MCQGSLYTSIPGRCRRLFESSTARLPGRLTELCHKQSCSPKHPTFSLNDRGRLESSRARPSSLSSLSCWHDVRESLFFSSLQDRYGEEPLSLSLCLYGPSILLRVQRHFFSSVRRNASERKDFCAERKRVVHVCGTTRGFVPRCIYERASLCPLYISCLCARVCTCMLLCLSLSRPRGAGQVVYFYLYESCGESSQQARRLPFEGLGRVSLRGHSLLRRGSADLPAPKPCMAEA